MAQLQRANERNTCRELSIQCLCLLVVGPTWTDPVPVGLLKNVFFSQCGTITAQTSDVWATEQSPAHKPKNPDYTIAAR